MRTLRYLVFLCSSFAKMILLQNSDILRSLDLQMLIRDYSEEDIADDVNTSLGNVEYMLISAAKGCLKIRIKKSYKNDSGIEQKLV